MTDPQCWSKQVLYCWYRLLYFEVMVDVLATIPGKTTNPWKTAFCMVTIYKSKM
jgi:hypothetical protein